MPTRSALLSTTIAILLIVVTSTMAFSQEKSPPSRNFDYWQPDWMVRELWGPGRMPKSMMVRLLRHTTFIQFGVPAEYAGATSTVQASEETIAAGGKLYARHCAMRSPPRQHCWPI